MAEDKLTPLIEKLLGAYDARAKLDAKITKLREELDAAIKAQNAQG